MLNKLEIKVGSVKGAAILLAIFFLGGLSAESIRLVALALASGTAKTDALSASSDGATFDSQLAANQSSGSDFASFLRSEGVEAVSYEVSQSSATVDPSMLKALQRSIQSIDEFKSIQLDTSLLVRPASPEQLSIYEKCHTPMLAHLASKTFGVPKSEITLSSPSQWIVLFMPKVRMYGVFGLAECRDKVKYVACVLDWNKELKSVGLLRSRDSEYQNREMFLSFAKYLASHPERIMY